MKAVLPFALALIMISLGMSLVRADFARVARSPRAVLLGLANLVIIAPALALGIASLFDLEPLFAVGLVLLGAAPGGAMANLLTHVARGDTALAVSMTAISSLLAAVTVPLYLGLAVEVFDAPIDADVNATGIALTVFAITVVPLAIGMAIRERRTTWVLANEQRVKRFALAIFALVVLGVIIAEGEEVSAHAGELLGATIALNLAAMTIAFTLARATRLTLPQATAVSIELGLHNSTLAIAVGTLVDDRVAIPAAVYSVVMMITATAFAAFMARRNAAAVLAPASEAAPAKSPA